jgi:hypothetical protein
VGRFSGAILLDQQAAPSAPAAGRLAIYAKTDGVLYAKDPSGLETTLSGVKDALLDEVGWWIPKDGSATIDALGAMVPQVVGTLTAATRNSTNQYGLLRKTDLLVTTAATTAVAGYRVATIHLFRGRGFFCRQIWAPSTGTATATHRAFCGVTAANAAPTDVQPSSQVSCVGMGWDSADANVQMMYNDATGTCTKVDLGASWPVPVVDKNNVYLMDIWCAANETKFNWKLTEMLAGVTVSGDTGASIDIPALATGLVERGYVSVGGTSSIVGMAMMGGYFEK